MQVDGERPHERAAEVGRIGGNPSPRSINWMLPDTDTPGMICLLSSDSSIEIGPVAWKPALAISCGVKHHGTGDVAVLEYVGQRGVRRGRRDRQMVLRDALNRAGIAVVLRANHDVANGQRGRVNARVIQNQLHIHLRDVGVIQLVVDRDNRGLYHRVDRIADLDVVLLDERLLARCRRDGQLTV